MHAVMTDLEPLSALVSGGEEPALPHDLWQGIIGPPGVTNWAGAGSAGKGLVWADVAARISRGWPMPPALVNDPLIDWDEVPVPGKVIVVSPEDAPEVVWHRVNAAGGDMDKIYNLSKVPVSSGDTVSRDMFSLPRDLGYLRKKVAELQDVHLIIIDNMMAVCTSTVSFNQQVRMNIMNPLEDIGREYGVRIVLVNHFTKGLPKSGLSSGKNLHDYIFGSVGVIQAARLTAVFLPEIPGSPITSITTYKSNGERAERPARYVIEGKGTDVHLMWEQPPLSANNPEQMSRLVSAVVRELEGATRLVTEQELAAWLRVPHPMVRHALKVAAASGHVECHRGAWGPPGLVPPEPELGELKACSEAGAELEVTAELSSDAVVTSKAARDADADRQLAELLPS